MLYFSRWKSLSILLAVLAGILFASPNLVGENMRKSLPDWLPHKAMTLGLDLQGGSHILMQVDRADLIREKLAAVEDDIRRILREERIGYRFSKSGDRAITVNIRDVADVEKAKKSSLK